jgi:hypothetical protein
LTRLTQVWAPFFSPLYIAVSLVGVFSLWPMKLTPWRRLLILAWICVSALGSLLVAPIGFNPADPTSSDSQLWRLLFLTPFQLAAPFGIAWLAGLVRRLPMTEDNHSTVGGVDTNIQVTWIIVILVIGILLAWTPSANVWLRFPLMLLLLPTVTAVLIRKAGGGTEGKFLSVIIPAIFLLVAFDSTTRATSQLLIDPHNCDRC